MKLLCDSLGISVSKAPLNSQTFESLNISKFNQRSTSISLIFEEVGPVASSSLENFRKVLIGCGIRLDEEQLVNILIFLIAKTNLPFEEKRPETVWNLDIVAEVLSVECRHLNWTLVAKALDNPKLTIRSDSDFHLLSRLFVRISNAPIPAAGVLSHLWTNRAAQFAFLTLASNSPRNIIDFAPLISQEQLMTGDGIITPPNFSWVCLPFYSRMLDLANNGFTMEVYEVMQKAACIFPEYVLLSLAQIQDQTGIRSDILLKILPLFTSLPGSKPSSLVVMRKLFSLNVDILSKLFCVALKLSTKLSDILNIENIFKALGPNFLKKLEAEASLDEILSYLCIKADRMEFNLEEKISFLIDQNIKNVKIIYTFLKQNIDKLRTRNNSQSNENILSSENCIALIRILKNFPNIIPLDDLNSLFLQLNQYASVNISSQSNPIMGNTLSFGQMRESQDESFRLQGPESEEIENLANSYFQKIYTSDIPLQEVINFLKQLKTSTEKKDQEIFRCMIHNLYDECRFFHKYPDKELQITGRLFGAIIQHQLVSSITLGTAQRYVIEALRKDPELGEGNEKLFKFGVLALDQFKSRLSEWPQYCAHLIQIPHLSRLSPDLFQEAQRGLSNQLQLTNSSITGPIQSNIPANTSNYHSQVINQLDSSSQPFISSGNSMIPNSNSVINSNLMSGIDSSLLSTPQTLLEQSTPLHYDQLFKSSNISAINSDNSLAITAYQQSQTSSVTKLTEIERMLQINLPIQENSTMSDTVKDQIHFILNQVDSSNLESKIPKLKDLLKSEHFSWFASYLVEKRISSQPNLHSLYLNILELLDSSELNKLVLDSTYYNVTKFLSSPNITTSSNERSVLRYFGMWLGQLTLARNKPILQRRIDLKELLFWGYETGRLIAVCSFVSKVIEGVKESKIFRSSNPWLMAILGVLKELYEIEDLKLNIKFEVQVLCKNINIKMEDIPKTSTLAKCNQPTKDNRNPDFNSKNIPAATTTTTTTPNNTAVVSTLNPVQGIQVNNNNSLPLAASTSQSSNSVSTTSISTTTASTPTNLTTSSISNISDSNIDNTLPVANQNPNQNGPADSLTNMISQVVSNIIVSPTLTYFSNNPNQKRIISLAIDKGIREIIQSAVDRAVAIATASTKQLILKDFANESNPQLLRSSAHNMVSTLTSSLTNITCKEPLRLSIGNHLRSLLASSISDQTQIEQIVQTCSSDNLELGSALIEKVAVEKSIREIDELLSSSYQTRKLSFESGNPFADPNYQILVSKISPEIQDFLKATNSVNVQSHVQLYEEFKKLQQFSMPKTVNLSNQTTQPTSNQSYSMAQAIEAYQFLYNKLDLSLRALQTQYPNRELTLTMLGDHEILQILKEMIHITQRTQSLVRNETAMTFSESIFSRLFETSSYSDALRIEVTISIVEAIREACGGIKLFNPDIISWFGKYMALFNNDELSRKICRLILVSILRARLVRSSELDMFFTMHIDGGRNLFWLEVALSVIKQYLLDNLGPIFDFNNTLDLVSKMKPSNAVLKRSIQKLLGDLKAIASNQDERATSTGNASSQMQNNQTPQKENSPKEQVATLLDRWFRIWASINDQLFSQFLQMMQHCGVLRTEESADNFFRVSIELCVDLCLKTAQINLSSDVPSVLNFFAIDALARLFLLLVRLADKETNDINVRVNLLNRILNSIVKSILEENESKINKKIPFDQRPYYRLLLNLSQELGIPDPKQEFNPLILPMIAIYSQAYYALQPSIIPAFAFSWLQLISKKWFLPHLLRNQKGWPSLFRLLNSLLLFLNPFLKSGTLPDPVKKIYKGSLRVLLVLLHDFPEFLCDFHIAFCDAIPQNCVQLRNLILSAFPRTMRLPDPFTPNLKLEILPEISQSPRILTDYLTPISSIKSSLDNYLVQCTPTDFPLKLGNFVITLPSNSNQVLTSLFLYLANFYQTHLAKSPSQLTPAFDIIKHLITNFDAENRYLLLNIIVNQLRYPNSHTLFFSNTLLNLFAEAENEFIQEQITRVLLERLIVHRPHPVSYP